MSADLWRTAALMMKPLIPSAISVAFCLGAAHTARC